ncbi:MAG: Glutathione-binding protein gsiB, partial [Candidatus Kaiserbacteria bacterium GW2011_GWC2_52_8b]
DLFCYRIVNNRIRGKLPSYYSDWSADFNDPDNFLYTFFTSKNSVARSFNYNNAKVSEQVENARNMVVPEERYKLYQDLEKQIVQEDAAWIPLFSLDHLFVVQPRVVSSGDTVVVSWTSVGTSACQIFASSQSIGEGMEGSRTITTSSAPSDTSMTFTLRCRTLQGTLDEHIASVTLR